MKIDFKQLFGIVWSDFLLVEFTFDFRLAAKNINCQFIYAWLIIALHTIDIDIKQFQLDWQRVNLMCRICQHLR